MNFFETFHQAYKQIFILQFNNTNLTFFGFI